MNVGLRAESSVRKAQDDGEYEKVFQSRGRVQEKNLHKSVSHWIQILLALCYIREGGREERSTVHGIVQLYMVEFSPNAKPARHSCWSSAHYKH